MSRMWLLDTESAYEVARAFKMAPRPSAEQMTAFQSAHETVALADSRLMKVAGSTAEIGIEGMLTERPDFWLWMFGIPNTSYADLRAALAQAAADPAIKSVVLRMNSPGGTGDGLFETLAALQAFPKPMTTVATKATSAAYAIAALTSKITATSAGAVFGSIGVACDMIVIEEEISITSTEAPNKRPDVTTAEGQSVVREFLDANHDLFVDAIAQGRSAATGKKVSAADVNAHYGRGASLLAAEAKKAGMIDGAPAVLRAVKAVASDNQEASAEGGGQETVKMDAKQLKAQHPELYATVMQEGRDEGVKLERDRATAHITMGEAAGTEGVKIALDAIKGGEGFTATTSAKYMSVAMNARDRSVRQQESDGAGTAVDGVVAAGAADPSDGAKGADMGDKTAAVLLARRGKKVA